MGQESEARAPEARTEGLLVRELADEVLVYDLESNRALCLNRAAAVVWRLCDGRRAVAEIARAAAAELGQAVPAGVVWLALRRLGRGGLLREPPGRPDRRVVVSRREVVRSIGLAAAGSLPAVVAIVAPTAAQAASCLPAGAGCTSSAQCCSGLCGETSTCVGP